MVQAFKLFEQDNPLNDVFIVKTKNPTDTMIAAAKIEKLEYVTKAVYGKGKVEKLFKFIEASRNVGIVLNHQVYSLQHLFNIQYN